MTNSRNKTCPKCNKNLMKNFYAKTCKECAYSNRKGSSNSNWKGSSVCVNCGGGRCRGNKTKLCGGCYRDRYHKGLPKCIGCDSDLSKHSSLSEGTGYCQKCYRGSRTRRWNPSLTNEFRQNGRTVNPDYRRWQIKIFKRDKFTCMKCKDSKGGNLNAHHIKNFSESDIDEKTNIKNGITLCKECHILFHKSYGYFNNNRIQIDEYLHQND